MNGSRRKITSNNLVRQRCAEGFNSGVKGLQSFLTMFSTVSTKPTFCQSICFSFITPSVGRLIERGLLKKLFSVNQYIF
jgi:hypothetical protein